jgi:hypothetical protein
VTAQAQEWWQVCEGGPRHRYLYDGTIEREGSGVVRAPDKLASVQKVIAAYGPLIAQLSDKYQFPAAWMVGLIAMESNGDPGAASAGVGARGLTQMMPATAKGLGLDPDRLWEPAYSIEAGLIYMQGQIKRYGLDLPVLAGAYNAGSRRCAAETACKTKGVKDGTFARNSWGLIEDCYQGVSSRYIERVVGAANEAVLLGYTGGGQGPLSVGISASGDAIVGALAFFGGGVLAAALLYTLVR